MTQLRRVCRVIAILTVLCFMMIPVYISLTPHFPSLPPSPLILTVAPSLSSSAAPLPPGIDRAIPIQPPIPPVIYVKDIYEGGYQSSHPEICPSLGAHLKVLILITSAPDHAGPRDAVRLTWGHFSRRSDLAIAFVLGSPPGDLKESLIKEDGLYRDLIIGKNLDSYNNMSLKTISMLEWASTYCSRVPYLLKTDDDMFINLPLLLDFLQLQYVVNASKVIWGKKIRQLSPIRRKWNKHYVPPAQFPGRIFPDYCNGPAYLMTGDCIFPLLKAAAEERYLRLEDVFLTGILARNVGIKRQHSTWFYNYNFHDSCRIQSSITVHHVRPNVQLELWRMLLDNRVACRTSVKLTTILSPTQYISGSTTRSGN